MAYYRDSFTFFLIHMQFPQAHTDATSLDILMWFISRLYSVQR
jgi:hypothetical protein